MGKLPKTVSSDAATEEVSLFFLKWYFSLSIMRKMSCRYRSWSSCGLNTIIRRFRPLLNPIHVNKIIDIKKNGKCSVEECKIK